MDTSNAMNPTLRPVLRAAAGLLAAAVTACSAPAAKSPDAVPPAPAAPSLGTKGQALRDSYVYTRYLNQAARAMVQDAAGNGYILSTMDEGYLPHFGTAMKYEDVTRTFRGIYVVSKLDPAGNVLWSKEIAEGSTDSYSPMLVAQDGNLALVLGYTGELKPFGTGLTYGSPPAPFDPMNPIFVVTRSAALFKVSAQDGSLLWTHDLGVQNQFSNVTGDLAEAPTGALYFQDLQCGVKSFSADGTPLVDLVAPLQLNCVDLSVDGQGNLFQGAEATPGIGPLDIPALNLSITTYRHVLLIKRDATGALTWVKDLTGECNGCSSSASLSGMDMGPDGHPVVTVFTDASEVSGIPLPANSFSHVLLKVDGATGDTLWSRPFSYEKVTTTGIMQVGAPKVDGNNAVYAQGQWSGTRPELPYACQDLACNVLFGFEAGTGATFAHTSLDRGHDYGNNGIRHWTVRDSHVLGLFQTPGGFTTPAAPHPLPVWDGQTFPIVSYTLDLLARIRMPLPTPPPVITCPPDVVVRTTGTDEMVTWADATAVDPDDAVVPITYSRVNNQRYPLGEYTVTATAEDAQANRDSCTFKVTVKYLDLIPPVIQCPANVVVEAADTDGMPVQFENAIAFDNVDPSPAVTADKVSGANYPVGLTNVTFTATDDDGNASSCTFQLVVRDTTAPALACPPDITAEATSPAGAVANFATSSTDALLPPDFTLTHASGSTFPLGITTVGAYATDDAGNFSSCSFKVTVVDTTRPQLACPGTVVVEADGPMGAVASWTAPQVADLVSAPALTLSAQSGSRFPLGETVVTVTAKDAANNESGCSFKVLVRDTTRPELSCPVALSIPAENAKGATVNYVATATDAVTSPPTVTASRASGTLFPLGSSSVTVTATDAAGNKATCSFTVMVKDVTPPELVCPPDDNLYVDTWRTGIFHPHPELLKPDSVSDNVSKSVRWKQSVNPRSFFPLWETVVTISATDEAGNVATCEYAVNVIPMDREGNVDFSSCASAGGPASAWLAGLLGVWLRRRRR